MTEYRFKMMNGDVFRMNLKEAVLDMDALKKESWIKINASEISERHVYINVDQIAYIETL